MQLLKATAQDKSIIQNLMQLYMYDFSEFVELDVEPDGLFAAYKNLDDYWTDPANRFPYIIRKNENPTGFALVRLIKTGPQNYFSMGEFFILRKYRRTGIGKDIAIQLFNIHKGNWEIFQRENNKPAQLFWRNVIAEYANGNFTEYFEKGKLIQQFKSL